MGFLLLCLLASPSYQGRPVPSLIVEIPVMAEVDSLADHTGLVAFTAPSCAPCRQMTAAWQALGARTVDFYKEHAAATRFHITHLPTTIAVEHGRETGRLVGTASQARLRELLSTAARLKAPADTVGGRDLPCWSNLLKGLIP
jgi:hypothetical protein